MAQAGKTRQRNKSEKPNTPTPPAGKKTAQAKKPKANDPLAALQKYADTLNVWQLHTRLLETRFESFEIKRHEFSGLKIDRFEARKIFVAAMDKLRKLAKAEIYVACKKLTDDKLWALINEAKACKETHEKQWQFAAADTVLHYKTDAIEVFLRRIDERRQAKAAEIEKKRDKNRRVELELPVSELQRDINGAVRRKIPRRLNPVRLTHEQGIAMAYLQMGFLDSGAKLKNGLEVDNYTRTFQKLLEIVGDVMPAPPNAE